MKLENGILSIDAQLKNEDINNLISEIVLKIDDINKVELENLDTGIATSSIFSLLHTIKQRKKEIEIPMLDEQLCVSSMGKIFFVK